MSQFEQRLAALERMRPTGHGPMSGPLADEFVRQVLHVATECQRDPAPPPNQQTRTERIVRDALAVAEPATNDGEYAARFWQAVTRGMQGTA